MSQPRTTGPSKQAIEAAARQQAKFGEFLKSEEYRYAVAMEGEGRDLAFVEIPSQVCGFSLRPITSLDLLNLSLLRSPFLGADFLAGRRKAVPEIPTFANADFFKAHVAIPAREIAAFLWVQSVDFIPRQRGLKYVLKYRRFVSRCRKLKYGEACESIRRFVDAAMLDRPQGGKTSGTQITSWLASSVAFVASKFHWSEREILNMPIARLFQYERAIVASAGKGAAVSNRSDKLRSEFLKELNAQREASN
jgi:hypothetical protein